jgi:hypothetical protein
MHISLDSALGRQRRLNSVGESVLQIAPNAAAAYSLRSLTGGDPKVVRVRRVIDNSESDFTASGISSGALVDFVNAIQTVGTAVNGTGSFDNYTVSNLSTTGFSADNSAGGTGSAGFPYVFKDDDVLVVKYTVTNFSSTSSLSPAIRGVSATNSVTGLTNSGTTFTANGTYTDTLTATADGTHLMFADGNTGSYTISNFEIVSHSSSGFVETWYDQSGNGNNALQDTASLQPQIVNAGSLVTGGLDFDGTDDFLELESIVGATNSQSIFGVVKLDALDGSTQMILDNRDGNGDGSAYFAGSNEFRYLFDSNSPIAQLSASTDQSLVSAFKTSSNVAIGIDGGTLDTASNTETISVATAPRIGSRSFSSASAFLGGEIAELIIYNADESSNRTALETNINSHYSIF